VPRPNGDRSIPQQSEHLYLAIVPQGVYGRRDFLNRSPGRFARRIGGYRSVTQGTSRAGKDSLG